MAHDISHPPFYLPGQETATAGNARGFWALDPCKQVGNDCGAGDECCSGFCRQSNDDAGKQVFQCVPPQGGCSMEGEKCNISSDCCGFAMGEQCIGGFCAQLAPK
jgi:hypothetical protein